MSKQILIVEDDRFLAEMIGKVLRTRGVRVTITHNGKEALESMEKDAPDVLLLDILLPVLSGYGVMEAMKEKHPSCPVIIMSNLSDKLVKEKCKKLDAKEYFVKNEMDEEALWPVLEKYLC